MREILIYYSCLFLRNSFKELCESEEKVSAMYKDYSWRKGQLFIVFYTYSSWYLISFAVKTNLMVHLMETNNSCVIPRSWRTCSKHCSWCAFAAVVKMVCFSSVMLIEVLCQTKACENRDTILLEVPHNESLYAICMLLMIAFFFRQSVFS